MPILVLDDEEIFRMALAENLREDGHVVREYPGPRQVPSFPSLGDVRLVITDFRMAADDLNGLAFGDAYRVAHPSTPIILLTAYARHGLPEQVAMRYGFHLLHKPVEYGELHQLIHRVAA